MHRRRVVTPPDGPDPHLWARCMAVATPECEQEQTIACDENWRLLIPLWRTEEL